MHDLFIFLNPQILSFESGRHSFIAQRYIGMIFQYIPLLHDGRKYFYDAQKCGVKFQQKR